MGKADQKETKSSPRTTEQAERVWMCGWWEQMVPRGSETPRAGCRGWGTRNSFLRMHKETAISSNEVNPDLSRSAPSGDSPLGFPSWPPQWNSVGFIQRRLQHSYRMRYASYSKGKDDPSNYKSPTIERRGCIRWWKNRSIIPCLIWVQIHPFVGEWYFILNSVQFSHSGMADSLQPHGLPQPRLSCPPPTLGACSSSYPLSRWCYSTISSSVVPFSSCLQSFPASGPLQMSQFCASGGQSIGASASILPMNIQDWFPLGWTGLSSLQSKGLSRVFSTPTVQKYQFFGTQLSLWSNSHIHTWLSSTTQYW